MMAFGGSQTCLLLCFSRASCLLSLLPHLTSVLLLPWSHHPARFRLPPALFLVSVLTSLQPPPPLTALSSVSPPASVPGHSATIYFSVSRFSLSCPVAASFPSSKSSSSTSRAVRSLSGTAPISALLPFRENLGKGSWIYCTYVSADTASEHGISILGSITAIKSP